MKTTVFFMLMSFRTLTISPSRPLKLTSAVVLRRRRGPEGEQIIWIFLADNGIQIAPFDEEQTRKVSEAFGRYGKGIDPKSRLNLADCASNALAKSLSVPLLSTAMNSYTPILRSQFA